MVNRYDGITVKAFVCIAHKPDLVAYDYAPMIKIREMLNEKRSILCAGLIARGLVAQQFLLNSMQVNKKTKLLPGKIPPIKT